MRAFHLKVYSPSLVRRERDEASDNQLLSQMTYSMGSYDGVRSQLPTGFKNTSQTCALGGIPGEKFSGSYVGKVAMGTYIFLFFPRSLSFFLVINFVVFFAFHQLFSLSLSWTLRFYLHSFTKTSDILSTFPTINSTIEQRGYLIAFHKIDSRETRLLHSLAGSRT